ncbi:MAG: hypothetical protein WBA74_08355 [Cyclobacteriaceae bacterium]
MNCSTGKRMYDTEDLAVEALIANRSRFHHGDNSGPINVYQCDDCGNWHFTSRGPEHPLLHSDEVQKRISLNREAGYWERKLR